MKLSSSRVPIVSCVTLCLFGAAAAPAPAQTNSVLWQYQIYAGSTHAHSSNTWSHGEQYAKATAENGKAKGKNAKMLKPDWEKSQGSPAAHFQQAKTHGYDFYTVTDHSQEEVFQPVSATNAAWLAARRAANETTDGKFVALAGYEHSENDGPEGTGHINVLNSAEYLNALSPGIDLPHFYDWLTKAKPAGEGPVVASFNHPGPRGYNNWAYCNPQVADVLTLLEVINSNNKVHYQAFLNALDQGWKVSPVCGNDNHGFWGITRHASRTFVLATERTPAALLEAMKQRRTYASLEGNLQCRYTVNGAIMGSSLPKGETFQFEIVISDPDSDRPEDRITNIEIVKEGGMVVQACNPAPAHTITWKPTITDANSRYFFVRVWNEGGGDAPEGKPAEPVAWLAPVWVTR